MNQGQVKVNGEPQEHFDGMQHNYIVKTNGTSINPKALDRLHIAQDDRTVYSSEQYMFPLTEVNVGKLKEFANVTSVEKLEEKSGRVGSQYFPTQTKNFPWNVDNFGPLTIPGKRRNRRTHIKQPSHV